MAVELSIFLVIAISAFFAYFFGIYFKLPYLFVLGCALFIGAGGLLWGFDGLIVGRELIEVSDAGVLTYQNIVVTMDNIGLSMLSLVFISLPILSALVIDFGSSIKSNRSNVFHY